MRPPSERDRVLEILDTVLDPEVPALSVVDLGIVRDVACDEDGVTVVITPTYSGCPAMRAIEADILAALHSAGFPGARVKTVYAPAWTSDWISDAGREKLRAYGIAPPEAATRGSRASASGAELLVPLTPRSARVACPFCGSSATEMRSAFGATACKAMMYCRACEQPFEAFKAI